mgnify:FL=1
MQLKRITRGRQLILGVDADEFWIDRSFEELAREQSAGQPVEPDDLYNAEATEDEREAFMAALATLTG